MRRIRAIDQVFIDHVQSKSVRSHRPPESFLCFSVKLYSELLHRFLVFALILSLLRRITGTRTRSLPVRNAASFILPVPYVSDFSITAARYFTDNLRVANGVHNEAEMAWYSDGPRICLHSVPSPSSFFWSPNTRLLLPVSDFLTASGEGKNAIDR